MQSHWRFLSGIIFLFCLKPALGNTNSTCSISSFLQSNVDDVFEFIREVKGKNDNVNITNQDAKNYKKITLKLELDSIIDERIKAYKDENNVLSKEIKDGKSRLEEILELTCSYMFAIQKTVDFDAPSLLRENFWNLCSEKLGLLKLPPPISYKNLEDLGATCPGLDSCEKNRNSDSLTEYNCQCGRLCLTRGTCCFDSPFLGLPTNGPFQSCQAVYGISSAYFMVDQCPRHAKAGDAWKELCAHGEENNFMTYVPVTSLRTNLTYKNYYCFACHEITEDYHFWEVKVESIVKTATLENGSPMLVYDSINKKWRGIDGQNNESVLITINKLSEFKDFVTKCRDDVITECHNNYWLDDFSRNNCSAYTALINIYHENEEPPYTLYRNPHCAVCNFEFLKDRFCSYIDREDWPILATPGSIDYDDKDEKTFKSNYSYTNIFDLTRHRCPDDTIWNPFSSECSPLKCSEGYSLKHGACILT